MTQAVSVPEQVDRWADDARRSDASAAVADAFLRLIRQRHPGVDWEAIGSEDELSDAPSLALAR
jgi:hypothetical protein